MPRTTTVSADLLLHTEEGAISITGDGRRLDVDLPSLRAGWAVVRAGSFGGARPARVVQVHRLLQDAGLTADVRLRGTPFARLGTDATPGAFARLLRLGGVEVHPEKPAWASIRRRPGLAAAVAAGLVALGLVLSRHRA
jgi:hypothetical protein